MVRVDGSTKRLGRPTLTLEVVVQNNIGFLDITEQEALNNTQ